MIAEQVLVAQSPSLKSYMALLTRFTYTIEPNPANIQLIPSCVPEACIIPAAAFIQAGRMKLYLGEKYDGLTLYVNKLSGGIRADCFIDVETIDFSEWLASVVEKDDYVVCQNGY